MRTCPGVPKRPCGTFMSSLETDPHALCPLCRGQRCDRENVCSLPRPASPVKPPSQIAGPSGFCQPPGGGEGVASLSEVVPSPPPGEDLLYFDEFYCTVSNYGHPHPEKQQLRDGRAAHHHSPVRARKHSLVPVPVARPVRPRSPAPSRSSDSDARKGSPLPRTSILALPVAPVRPSISERLLSLAHSRLRSPSARPSRQHAVGPAGGKEGASPTCAPIADRSARHHLRETKSSRRHLSPSHHHQRSPKRSRGHSPAPSVEFSPAHSYARSPDQSRAYPPARHSPARHSPARSYVHAPAHARHHSRPYDHLSPSGERSPAGCSPTVGHSDRKDPRQDAPPGRRSQDSPPRKRRITAEQGRSAERSRQSSFSFQEGLVVTTPKGREVPFSPAVIADTASVTRLPWFRHMIKAVVQAIKPSSTDQRRDPGMGSPPLKKRKGVGFVITPPQEKLVSRNPIRRTPSPSPTSAAPPPPVDEFISSSGDSSDSENSSLAPRGEFSPDRGEVAREEVPPRVSVLESYFPSRRESKDTRTVSKSSSKIRQEPPISREDVHVSPQEDLLGMGDLAATPSWITENQPSDNNLIVTMLQSFEEKITKKIESIEEKFIAIENKQLELEEKMSQLIIPDEATISNRQVPADDDKEAAVGTVMNGHPWPRDFSVKYIRSALKKVSAEDKHSYGVALANLIKCIMDFKQSTYNIDRTSSQAEAIV
ncbi:serine/arginine repetitive matrix protein 1-like [Palaemon carinicauda]|uniref:serine/arginine repetitive matrix protein 1-like n=1 Tax=Palaemon carinicauda TaxID=392227 RepID=UPI0035B63F69